MQKTLVCGKTAWDCKESTKKEKPKQLKQRLLSNEKAQNKIRYAYKNI